MRFICLVYFIVSSNFSSTLLHISYICGMLLSVCLAEGLSSLHIRLKRIHKLEMVYDTTFKKENTALLTDYPNGTHHVDMAHTGKEKISVVCAIEFEFMITSQSPAHRIARRSDRAIRTGRAFVGLW